MPDVTPTTAPTTPPPPAAPEGAAAIAAAVVAGATAPKDGAAPAAAPAETPAAPPAPRDDTAQRFALLAKESKRLAQEKQELAKERAQRDAALKAREDAIASRQAKYDEIEKAQAAALKDPGGHLRKVYGDDWYDKLTEYRLTGEKEAPASLAVQAVRDEAKAEVERLRKENEDRWAKVEEEKKAATASAKEQAEAHEREVIETWRSETHAFLKADPEKYELINLNDAHSLVTQVIEATFEKTKRVLSTPEAAELVEKELEARLEKNYASKRWAARAAAKPASELAAAEPARTITNALGGTSAAPASGASPHDRYARAVAAMEEVAAQAAGKK